MRDFSDPRGIATIPYVIQSTSRGERSYDIFSRLLNERIVFLGDEVITAGMAIYDTMQYIKCDVSTICVGMAASMGAFLLAGGTKGKRMILPNAEVMIHQPSGGAQGQATEIQITAEWILRTKKHMAEILAENCGQSLEKVLEDTERDHWMDAEQALSYGLVDRIFRSRGESEGKA